MKDASFPPRAARHKMTYVDVTLNIDRHILYMFVSPLCEWAQLLIGEKPR